MPLLPTLDACKPSCTVHPARWSRFVPLLKHDPNNHLDDLARKFAASSRQAPAAKPEPHRHAGGRSNWGAYLIALILAVIAAIAVAAILLSR